MTMAISFFRTTSLCFVTAFAALACNSFQVQGEPAASLVKSTMNVTQIEYSMPRIGDIAPQFASTLKGHTWNSHDALGQRAIELLLIGDSPVLVSDNTTPEKSLASVVTATKTLRGSGVETFISSSAVGIKLSGIDKNFDALAVPDNGDVLHDVFHPDSIALTLVAIDKAGFLRRMEVLRQPEKVGDVMQQIGDCTPQLAVGKIAPDFSLSDMNGRVRRLSELRGRKNLLLTFFPKCFTGGCANHLTALRDKWSNFDKNDTEIWAVSVDPAGGERGQLAFAARLNLPFPLIPDVGRNLSLLYGAADDPTEKSMRMSVFIDKDGIVRFIDKDVYVMTHGADVLDEMKTAGIIK